MSSDFFKEGEYLGLRDAKKGPEDFTKKMLEKEEPLTDKEKDLLLIRREELYQLAKEKLDNKSIGKKIGVMLLAASAVTANEAPMVAGGLALASALSYTISRNATKGTKKKGHSVYNYISEYNAITNKLVENGYDAQEDKLEALLKEKLKEEQSKAVDVRFTEPKTK